MWVNVEMKWDGAFLEMETRYPDHTWIDGPKEFKGKRLCQHDSARIVSSFMLKSNYQSLR